MASEVCQGILIQNFESASNLEILWELRFNHGTSSILIKIKLSLQENEIVDDWTQIKKSLTQRKTLDGKLLSVR